jgi:hypothetical protein
MKALTLYLSLKVNNMCEEASKGRGNRIRVRHLGDKDKGLWFERGKVFLELVAVDLFLKNAT